MPKPVRIAYLVSRYPATNHTFILREIVELRSAGFDIQPVTIRGDDRDPDRLSAIERHERARTMAVLPFGTHFLGANLAVLFRHPVGYFAGLRLAWGLARSDLRAILFHSFYFLEAVVAGHAIEKLGFSHIHTHFSSTVAAIAARIFGMSFSMTIHGPDEFRDVIGFGLSTKVAHSLFVTTISNYAKSQIIEASAPGDWGKIEVCRLGVDPAVFTPGHKSGRSGGFRVVFVGRLAPVKAQQFLISACSRLVSSGLDITLHLVGGGPDRDRLLRFAASLGMERRVVFEGPKNQEEVIEICAASDVFALASFAEGVPVVLMEAMAMEIPCVATWVNGIPELIRHGEEGLLVAPSDVEGLAAAIQQLLADRDLRSRLGRAARLRILREYNLADNTASLAGIFRRYID